MIGMTKRRGGRVQINALQFQEIVDRVQALEDEVTKLKKKPSVKKETK